MAKIRHILRFIYLLPRAFVGLFIIKETRRFAVLGVAFVLTFILTFCFYDSASDLGRNQLAGFQSAQSQFTETAGENSNPVKFNLEEYRLPEKINPNGLNLIFFADQYPSWDDFESDANSLMSELKKIEPWQSYHLYNIYKINPKNAQGLCYIKIKDERKPVLRCQEEINNYLNNLPLEKFRLIVLSRQDFQSWANLVKSENSGVFLSIPYLLSNNLEKKTFGLLFAHLLGHAFGLKDEEIHVIAKAGGAPHMPDGPNCAPDAATAEKWWGDLTKKFPKVGYFKGCCGDENYIKPTESSIMNLNTGSKIVHNYGPVSERYLKKILDYCFTPQNAHQAKTDTQFFQRYPEFERCWE
ncbi:MAG: hypothetical protein U9P63_01380 [Patescibacteria group bacterium]|nr:hypothetical protein [Patescibacteria group bacterium]